MKAYLEKLIKVLNEDDLKKIKSIHLKVSKMKIFLAYLVETQTSKEMTKQELMVYLRVDDKLYRKMKSILLRKCYEALVPEGGLPLLDILSRYRLVENYKRELAHQEIKIKRQNDSKIKSDFYDNAITYLLRLPFSSQNIDELEHYAKLNLQYSKNSEKEVQAYYHSGRILVIRIIEEFYGRDLKNPNKILILNELKNLDDANKKLKDEKLLALSLYCNAIYVFCIERNIAKAKNEFLNLLNNMTHLDLLPTDFALSVNGFYASSCYLLNEFDEALVSYEKYVTEKNPFFFSQPHLMIRLCELYMIKDREKDALEILELHLKRFAESGEPDAVQLTSITFAKYYLFIHDLPKAFESLQVSREHLNKKFYLLHDVDQRTIEQLYFMISGDMKFARSILIRTLKFLREKVKTKELGQQIKKQEVLSKLFRAKAKSKSLKPFIPLLESVFTGYDYIYVILLKKYCINQEQS